jgi:hypothetical protein
MLLLQHWTVACPSGVVPTQPLVDIRPKKMIMMMTMMMQASSGSKSHRPQRKRWMDCRILDPELLDYFTRMWSSQRVTALVAWAIGSAVALLVEKNYPHLSTALSAFIAGAIAYWVISSSMGKSDT